MKRVAIYCRTSTQEQSTDLQRDELADYVSARQWTATEVYEDKVTGTHLQRPAFKRLVGDAKLRRFDIILVWKLDRAFRSLKDLVNMLQEFTDLGIEFVSLREQIDLTTATGRLLVHLLGAFSEFESGLCRERVRSGLDAARRRGRKLGRPRSVDREAVQNLRRKGFTFRQISNELGISHGSVADALKGS